MFRAEWTICQIILITRSTCILTLAIALVSSTSTGESWSFPIVNADVHKLACVIPTDNAKSNLSQPTWHLLPSNNLFETKLWQCTVNARNYSRNVSVSVQRNVKFFLTPTVLAYVIWTTALARKFDGRSKNISNQSILYNWNIFTK